MSNEDKLEWILTFDIGSKCTGFAFGTSNGELVKYGKYVAEIVEKDQKGRRLYNFSKWVSKTIRSLPRNPELVIIESPYYSGNPQTYAVLNKYIAVAQREVFRILQQEAEFMSPRTVKARLEVPKGKTYKERKVNMVNFINKKYGLSLKYHYRDKKITGDDIADAIALLRVYSKQQEGD